MKYILILIFLISCGKSDNSVKVDKKTPEDLIKQDLASLEYEYSALSSIAGTSLLSCSNNNYGLLIDTICLYKDESDSTLKSNLVSALLSFSTYLYTDLQELRSNIDELNQFSSNEIAYNNRRLYLVNKINDFYTKFNFISGNSTNITTTISSLQNAVLNSNNTQNLISILQTQINNLDTEIDNTATQITNLQTQINTLEDEDTSLQAQIVALTADLASLDSDLHAEINAITTQIANLQAQIDALEDEDDLLQSQVDALTADLSDLNSDLTTLNSTVVTAQTDIGNIQVNLNTLLDAYLIGSENVGVGPVYEAILKRRDKKQVIGYRRGINTVIRLPANPLASTNGSPVVTITTSAAHGLNVGDVITLSGLAAGANFTVGQLSGTYSVQTITSTTKFTITLTSNANTTSAGFAGSTGGLQKVFTEGLSVLWVSDQVSDVAVRQTTVGTTPYNYIIRRISTDTSNDTSEICYDRTNHAATFATINAATVGGSGNIRCL